MSDDDRPLRRQRRRATAPQGAPPEPAAPSSAASATGASATAAPAEAAPVKAASAKAAPAKAAKKPRHSTARAGRRKSPDRGLHDLVGGGSTQLSVSRALRARDVNRPTEADLAAAERSLQVVRRDWRPQ